MKTIEFKFDIDQHVQVIISKGLEGTISMLGHDDSGNRYYVQLVNGEEGWYKEKQLGQA